MKNILLLLSISIFIFSACGSGSDGQKLCDCYKTLQTNVLAADIDLKSDGAHSELQAVYDNLMDTDDVFKTCRLDFFKRSSMSIICMEGIGDKMGKCVDCDVFKEIIAAGPLIYRMEE